MANVDHIVGYIETKSGAIETDLVFAYVEYTGGAQGVPWLLGESWFGNALAPWTSTRLTGATLAWTSSSTQARNDTYSIKVNTSASGSQTARLANGFNLDLSTILRPRLQFWMYLSQTNNTKHDAIQPVYSTDGGSNWSNLGASIDRLSQGTGWYFYDYDLSSVSPDTTVRIGFLATAAGSGSDMFLDDIFVTQGPENTELDATFAYAETVSGGIEIDNLFAYIETTTINGSNLLPQYGARWSS